jgi:hypothetical protein
VGRARGAIVCGLALAMLAAAPVAAAPLETNPFSHRPATVSAKRFLEIVTQQAPRWNLAAVARPTTAQTGVRDGRWVVGFEPGLPRGTLGRRTVWYRAGRVVEQDVELSPDYRWEQGPGYPSSLEFDLTSVLIHELAHVADPEAAHAPRCANVSLADSLGPGDWWRGTDDWFKRGCRGAPKAPARRKP